MELPFLSNPTWQVAVDCADIWYADLEGLQVDIERCYAVLDETERQAAAKFIRPTLGERYILVHGLLRILLSQYLAVEPNALNIGKSASGKPFLVDYPSLQFNLSHSGTQWVIGLTRDKLIGVDIEIMRMRTQLLALAQRCFGATEMQYWLNLPEAEQLSTFFEFWTRKEAFVKADGRGLGLGLQQCVIDPYNPERFLSLPAMLNSASEWSCRGLALSSESRAAVVMQTNHFEVKIFHLVDFLGNF